jgi:pyruvate/2-oxoacid:ferredoxin oxidoreductase alpha subunit/Pyruvate/2-oxoacid:ferredoxin oxidoreductase gamma subunit
MAKDVFTLIIGGKAGQGIKKAGIVAANFFAELKRDVFQNNDYPSLIRGGHNFSVVSTSTKKIFSHYMKADLVVVLDQRSYDIHLQHLSANGVIVYNSDKIKGNGVGLPLSTEAKKYTNSDIIEGVAGIAILTAFLNVDMKKLDDIIRQEYGHHVEDNLAYAHAVYAVAKERLPRKITLKQGDKKHVSLSGGDAIGLGAAAAGSVLFCLGQRPGPSTGVPTYTEQGELLFSLYPGQGEFPRIVASPGTIEESFYLTAELLNLVWRFQTPGILLFEKHLSESSMSVTIDVEKTKWAEPLLHKTDDYKRYRDTKDGISPLLFPPSESLIKWSSYEHDERGFTTETAEGIAQMHEKRLRKQNTLIEELKQMRTVNTFGDGELVIFTFGSTTMSVLEAIDYAEIKATVVQPIYFQPFPVWELERYKKRKAIVVEQNSTGQLEQLLKDKIGVMPVSSIRQYDGRPFDPIDLAGKIQEVANHG